MLVSVTSLVALCCVAQLASAELLKLHNPSITIGIDTARGGSLAFLTDNNAPSLNLINTHDQGREIQQSYYSGPRGYRGGHWNGSPWWWNPIGAGDHVGHSGRVLKVNHTGDKIYVKSRPLQWANDDVECNCTFETYVTLDINGAYVRNRLVTFREDDTVYHAMEQELPASYYIGRFSKLWMGEGGGGARQVKYPTGKWTPGKDPWGNYPAVTGRWAAFTDSSPSHYGVGIGNNETTHFKGGFAGTPNGGATTGDSETGYIAPLANWVIAGRGTRVYCFRVAIGNLNTLGKYFEERANREPCTFPDV
jgi:hypothetical protein